MDKQVFWSLVSAVVVVFILYFIGHTLGSSFLAIRPIYHSCSIYNPATYFPTDLISLILGVALVAFLTAGFIFNKKPTKEKCMIGGNSYIRRIREKHHLLVPFCLLIIILVGFFVWQAGTCDYIDDIDRPIHWLAPLTPTISYKTDGNFSAAITNVFFGPITVNSVTANDTYGGENIPCNGSIVGNRTIERGKNFKIAFSCPKKEDGGGYDLIVTVNYTGHAPEKSKVLINRERLRGQAGY